MNINEKIKTLRKVHHLTQEDMANKMGMSVSGYAKIERGETLLQLDRLEKIAHIFNMDIIELMNTNEKSIIFQLNENSNYNSANYYGNSEDIANECEKLKLMLQHKEELLKQKEQELQTLKDIITLLKQQN
ncbi:DNA-binding XRE family transcriptional regulator [Volucribacter psittacicida]|uniref:DNA-binding XRE family transcriptional regulator n=1 Tax=Volucribacter psittacicida TaxID=203482 RepID=A0A4R1G836_9PAST|nr:helix-turn-helix transcriptional regulator [Volucribacter psittacicida]TCK01849.1 DNA-binding XRE family transcriptional regulator [Volucribacter psittacicida]